jgi:hypothetical protein
VLPSAACIPDFLSVTVHLVADSASSNRPTGNDGRTKLFAVVDSDTIPIHFVADSASSNRPTSNNGRTKLFAVVDSDTIPIHFVADSACSNRESKHLSTVQHNMDTHDGPVDADCPASLHGHVCRADPARVLP